MKNFILLPMGEEYTELALQMKENGHEVYQVPDPDSVKFAIPNLKSICADGLFQALVRSINSSTHATSQLGSEMVRLLKEKP